VCCKDSVFADVGMTIFQAGVADGDQQFEVFSVFGGNRELCHRYICLNVAGGNHHNIRGR